jgi:hypothetical protein
LMKKRRIFYCIRSRGKTAMKRKDSMVIKRR